MALADRLLAAVTHVGRFSAGICYGMSAAIFLLPIWMAALLMLLSYQHGDKPESLWYASMALFGVAATLVLAASVFGGVCVSCYGARNPCCEEDDTSDVP
jgi:hypothetical protein